MPIQRFAMRWIGSPSPQSLLLFLKNRPDNIPLRYPYSHKQATPCKAKESSGYEQVMNTPSALCFGAVATEAFTPLLASTIRLFLSASDFELIGIKMLSAQVPLG